MAASSDQLRKSSAEKVLFETKRERRHEYRPRCSYSEDGASRFCVSVASTDTHVDASVENVPQKTEQQQQPGEKYGYGLYPERNEFSETVGGRQHVQRIKCERKVYSCLQNSSLVRLMLSALKSSGCEVDMRRHIACEVCDTSVTGGYDTETNQIVVCQNTAKSESMIQGVLTHELIHMFDYCRADVDFKNLRHLACTEIRAANLAHCSFMSAWMSGTASPFNVAGRHAECVKDKAMASVMAVRRLNRSEARAVVDSVFDKCYNDLEPIGRRLRRGTRDMDRAYEEKHLMGYGD